MSRSHTRHVVSTFLCTALILLAPAASARVSRIEVTKRSDWLGGKSLGAAGSYELVAGRIEYTVDPADPANRSIADVSLAPRNSEGRIHFSGSFLVLRPKDPASARGTVLLEIPNRGGTQLVPFFYRLPSGQRFSLLRPDTLAQLDEAFLFEQGFTVAWLGWQFDVPDSVGLRLNVPVVDVTGDIRRTHIGQKDDPSRVLPLTVPGGYPAAGTDQRDATLSVYARIDAPGTPVPRAAWSFAREDSGGQTADPSQVILTDPFPAGQLSELIYRAKGSPVAGLGLAAVRDFVAYLKHGDVPGPLREHPRTLPSVIGYGYSQSARFLRAFLHDGFNADEGGRRVFDGLLICSAGAGRGDFNHRFAVPGVAGNSVLSLLEPVDVFPFTDVTQDDPSTGERGGLLERAERQRVVPKIFHTYSSTEYWARVGSLAHTSVDGVRDVPLHPSTRLYFIAGTPHSIGLFPPQRSRRAGPFMGGRSRVPGSFDYALNPASTGYVLRALLVALDDWVRFGVSPPASRYPTLRRGELVRVENAVFPKLPGVEFPRYMPRNWRMDFGPDFTRTGVRAWPRPRLGAPYVVHVPRVGSDGNEDSGILLPHVAAPLGIYTGWNFTNPRYENLDYLAGLFGAFIPFSRTVAERVASGDPRPSILERYGSRAAYLARVRQSAESLVLQRYLRREDVDRVVGECGRTWDFVMQAPEGSRTN